MLQLVNPTPFVAKLMLLGNERGIDTLYTLVKATFTTEGPRLLAETQLPIALVDEFYGAPLTSSIRTPSDVSIGKTGTDILVRGSAWAPDGVPAWQMDVSITVGATSKTVRVFGDRVWEGDSTAATIGWVAPFLRMPLVWERAYGGTDNTERGPSAEPRNPVGVGFRAAKSLTPVVGRPLPNIEDPRSLITSPSDTPVPTGFAPLAAHWVPRRLHAGTYDENWQKTRAPYLPDDFDLRFCQLASSDLMLPNYLQGGEVAELCGMTPTGLMRFQVPQIGVKATYELDKDSVTIPACLDTLLVEPDEQRFAVVWRAALPCDKKVLKVREVAVDLVDRRFESAA